MAILLKKSWTIFSLVIVALALVGYFFIPRRESEPIIEPNTKFSDELDPKIETLEGDLLGIGSKQRIVIAVGERKVKVEVYEGDKLTASNVFDGGLVRPTSQYSLIKVNESQSREYIRWDQFSGPHQIETLILTTGSGIVRPVLVADYENEQWYAPFWSIRDNTYIGDIDGDGISEVVEYVDEYPPDAPRLVDVELEKIARDEFPDEKEDDMWKIVSRENYGDGRGRKVIWNVYTIRSDDPLIFQKANKEDYEILTQDVFKAMKMVNEQVEGSQEVISRYDLSLDSIEFNDFVRDFWTQGYPYTQPFSSN